MTKEAQSTVKGWRTASRIYEGQERELDFEFHNCYLVEMGLAYGETYAELGACFFTIMQTVVMDKHFTALFVTLQL